MIGRLVYMVTNAWFYSVTKGAMVGTFFALLGIGTAVGLAIWGLVILVSIMPPVWRGVLGLIALFIGISLWSIARTFDSIKRNG